MGAPAHGPALEGLTSRAWREVAEICGHTADELYSPLCFIENDVTDTQARARSPCALQHGAIKVVCSEHCVPRDQEQCGLVNNNGRLIGWTASEA